MECPEVRKQLPGLSLGDLDAEPARAVQDHLKTCDACREESARITATVTALESAPPAVPSSERREKAVAAMAQAQAEEAERYLAAKPRRWIPRGFAAGVLIVAAVAASLLLGSPDGLDLSVAEVTGRADVCRADSGLWAPLGEGDVVGANDRVITHQKTFVRFRVESGSLYVDEDSSIALGMERQIMLDRGRLYADLPEPISFTLVISDTANNSVAFRQGSVEASLREAKGKVAGIKQERKEPGTADSPAPRVQTALRLRAVVVAGEAELGGSREQRLRVSAGEEGGFDIDGQPGVSAGPAEPAAWWRREP